LRNAVLAGLVRIDDVLRELKTIMIDLVASTICDVERALIYGAPRTA
jgi:hypothetical protein